MNYSAEIIVKGDANNLKKLFEPESKDFGNERASYTIDSKGEQTHFKITAKDSTALRAVLNSITKTLAVYEKTKNIVKNG